MAAPLFGVFFVGNSFPITNQHFTQVDATHWVLDVCGTVAPSYWDLKEVSLFQLAPNSLDPSAALALYVKAGSSEWLYRGCVHNGHPSDVMPLQWPASEGGNVAPPAPGSVQIGVSIEPKAEALAKEGSKLGEKAEYARRVAMDLFRFLESFGTQQYGDKLLVPANALDRWLNRFNDKFRRDPDYLTRQREQF